MHPDRSAPIEDLQHHTAQLVLGVVCEGGRHCLQQVQERSHEVAQEIAILLSVDQLDALADLCHPRKLLLNTCSVQQCSRSGALQEAVMECQSYFSAFNRHTVKF